MVAALIALWLVFVVVLNAPFERSQAASAGTEIGFSDWSQKPSRRNDRSSLPAPGAGGMVETTFEMKPTSKRSLVYHAWITISATLAGFGMGTALGVALAIGIVHTAPWIAR